jgi:hypothetical protein
MITCAISLNKHYLGKILTRYTSNKGVITRMYRELKKLNSQIISK